MTVKCTMFLQLATAASTPNSPTHRIGGWSESWYFPGTSVPNAITAFNGGTVGILTFSGLCGLRAAMLPVGGSVVGQRFQVVDPAGLSQSTSAVFPSASALAAAAPQTALLITVPGTGVRNVRRFILRGLPISQSVEGEYSPSLGFTAALQAFFAALGAGPFEFRGRDLSQPTQPILSISTAGVITTLNAPTVAVGSFIRVLKSKDTGGNLRGGRFPVTATTTAPNTVTVFGWTFPPTSGGTYRPDLVIYPAVNAPTIAVGRTITRRVGRPFIAFRGRRSRRR